MSSIAIIAICIAVVAVVFFWRLASASLTITMRPSTAPVAPPTTPAIPVIPATLGIRARLQAWWAIARSWIIAHKLYFALIAIFTLSLIAVAIFNIHYNNTFH